MYFRPAVRAVLCLRRGGIVIRDTEFFPEAGHLLYGSEDGEGDDEEVDDGLEEVAVCDGGFSDSEREARDIDSVEKNAEYRGDDVGDERCHDLSEGGADDDTDREIDDIATECEFLEILEHSVLHQRSFRFLSGATADTLPLVKDKTPMNGALCYLIVCFARVRMARVESFIFTPLTRLVWTFTLKVRFVAIFEWLRLFPTAVPRPVNSQVRLIRYDCLITRESVSWNRIPGKVGGRDEELRV